jgi:DNA-binding transcriptional ArsR family regulator
MSMEDRDILEQAQIISPWPIMWIHSLPNPKDGATVLWVLSQIPPGERLFTLMEGSDMPLESIEIFRDVAARGEWNPKDQEVLRNVYPPDKPPPRLKNLALMLDICTRVEDFGEHYLSAMRSYQRVFFTEEEKNIRPFLEDAVIRAKELAAQMSFDDLVEELSLGVRLWMDAEKDEWILVPSFWLSPLVFFENLSEESAIFVFGARPPDVSLVPGDMVPDGMLRVIKTLADPTRLRILRYLSRENISPAELSRRLRLRAPTVTHHLNALRLAGLVYLMLEVRNERRYAARLDAIDEMFDGLKDFLVESSEEDIIKDREN